MFSAVQEGGRGGRGRVDPHYRYRRGEGRRLVLVASGNKCTGAGAGAAGANAAGAGIVGAVGAVGALRWLYMFGFYPSLELQYCTNFLEFPLADTIGLFVVGKPGDSRAPCTRAP